jgi:TM2 domain-containing membrane protein YozV
MSEENNPQEEQNNNEQAENSAENLKNEAKRAADEFKEGWNEVTNKGENKKMLAGILGILLGGLGVHKFILGYNQEGFILLGLTLVGIATSCLFFGIFLSMAAGVIGLIEGIIYLTKSDEEFYETYQANKKPWF